MIRKRHITACLIPLCLPLAGCVGLGGNVKGAFTCRAPAGTCAPSRTIDERATRELARSDADTAYAAARQRAGIVVPADGSDPARTAERRLRVVFPAHVDETGTLHDEAIAWTVVEAPHWAAELRADSAQSSAPLARQIGRQLKATQAAAKQNAGDADMGTPPNEFPPAAEAGNSSPFELASPPALPSTVGEARPGADAPVAEGSDMAAPPHDRTSRPSTDALRYPNAAAIDAARARSAKPTPPAADHPSPDKKDPQP